MNEERTPQSNNEESIYLKPLPDCSLTGNYRKSRRLAINFCRNQWTNQIKGSPAFGMRKVKVTGKFIDYLSGKSKTKSYFDALNRMRHIPNAKQILESVNDIFEKRIVAKDLIRFSLLGQIEGGQLLKVVVSENPISKELAMQTIYEVTIGIHHALGPHLKPDEFNHLLALLKHPIGLIHVEADKRIKGRIALLGQAGERNYNLLIYADAKLVFVKLKNADLPIIKMGTEIEICRKSDLKTKLKINGF